MVQRGEHGPISPRQYVKLGHTLKLENAFPAQPAQFIIRVMWGTDYEEKSGPVPSPQLGDLRWICFAQEGVRANEDLSEKYFFRKEFEIPQNAAIADACFSFAVDDHLVLCINGRKVDEGGDRERMTDWNVTRFLQPGKNVIAAVASNSNGLIVAGLAARLTVTLADGQSVSVESDKSWKSTSGEVPEGWKSCGFDDSAWSPVFAAEETAMSNITLQPHPEAIQDRRDTTITRDGEALVFSASNARDEAIWEETKLPCWDQRIDMRRHRGIGMHVTGDGSGAILVFQIPGRDYVVPIDFTGRRYVEIPNGEAAWFEARWGWRMGSKSTQYGGVRQCKLGFGHIPARTDVKVKVEGLKALVEIPTELVDPVIRTGNGTLAIKGSVDSGQYLVYEGGDTAGVYDQNWHLLKELDVKKSDYVVPNGWSEVSVTGKARSNAGNEEAAKAATTIPWLEVQFITEGEAMIVKRDLKNEG